MVEIQLKDNLMGNAVFADAGIAFQQRREMGLGVTG
jgi:hypothetical protein